MFGQLSLARGSRMCGSSNAVELNGVGDLKGLG